MKVLEIGNFGTSWDGSLCDEEHIARALEVAGHQVGRFQREDTLEVTWPDFNPDVILIAQWHGYDADMMKKLRKVYNAPLVYWAFDYQWDSHEEWHFRLAKQADLFLSKELDHKEDYIKMGANFHWFSQDFAPTFLDKYPYPVDKEYDVLFTGSFLPQATFRNELLQAVDKQFNLHVFTVTPDGFASLGLKNIHPAVVDYGLPELYAKAKINLSCDWKQADGYWSDRVAQILCCGGFVINKFVPLQDVAFPKSVVHFYSIEECLALITSYLEQPNLRQYYADEGYKFAQEFMKVTFTTRILTIVLQTKGLVHEQNSVV